MLPLPSSNVALVLEKKSPELSDLGRKWHRLVGGAKAQMPDIFSVGPTALISLTNLLTLSIPLAKFSG